MCQSFNEAFNINFDNIPYNLAWSDKKGGYLVNNLPHLTPGEVRKSVSPGGRRIILIGTPHGTVVVSDLFTQQGRTPAGKDVVMAYMPAVLEKIIGYAHDNKRLDDWGFQVIFGPLSRGGTRNIGYALS